MNKRRRILSKTKLMGMVLAVVVLMLIPNTVASASEEFEAGKASTQTITYNTKGNYVFSLKDIDISGYNYNDLEMSIYNASGKKIGTVITYKGKAAKTTLKNLKKGTYYLKISSPYEFSGKYTFKVTKK